MTSTSGDIAPSTRRILIDDASAQIQYSGNWTVNSQGIQDKIGDFGPTFQQTLHGTPSPSGNLSFTFEGSSAAVYGIVSMIGPISFEVEPIWECFIDGESTGTPTTIYTNQNGQKLCDFDKLDFFEAHTLAIHTTSNQQLFWVDYIEYTPSSTVNFTGTFVSIQQDDHFLVYDDTWQSSSSGAKSTSTVGATVNTSFTGTGVVWYGEIPSDVPRTPSTGAYSIDGQPPTPFTIRRTPSTENSTSPPSLFNQLFFETPVLPFDEHNITVTYTSGGIPLSLERLVIRDSSVQITSIDTTNPSPSQPVSASSRAPSTSKIVGATFGALIALVLLIVSLFFTRRWYRRRDRPARKPFPEWVPPPNQGNGPAGVPPSDPLPRNVHPFRYSPWRWRSSKAPLGSKTVPSPVADDRSVPVPL